MTAFAAVIAIYYLMIVKRLAVTVSRGSSARPAFSSPGVFGQPLHDHVGDLEVVAVHHHHVAVALDAHVGKDGERCAPAHGLDRVDRVAAAVAPRVAVD